MAILIVLTMMIWLIMMIIMILMMMMMMMMIMINTEKLGILEHYLMSFIEIITNQ